MWPMLLNLTRDECRLTLRRLELEAYSNMVNVFRAQGALEDNRKKLLEELRAVLHISHDRHSAEARRVSNDQLLATIAEQLSGPNTGLGWISEGRRKVPLLPRGIPQTAFTEIADKAAELAAAENKEIQKRLEEKMVAPKWNEEEMADSEGQTAETSSLSETMDEVICPPVAMEDQTLKLWDTELITRKRKVPEGGTVPDDVTVPVKSMRNIPVNTSQRHLDLTQIYSKFSQPATSKLPGQSKHSYNQVSKVSTSKSNEPHAPRSAPQKRAPRAPKQTKPRASSKRKSQEVPLSPGKQYNPVSMQLDYAGPPNTFQASYAQAVLGSKPAHKSEYDDMKPAKMSSAMMVDSPTMQLLTQPATVPHELEVPETHPDDVTSLQAQSAPPPKQLAKQYILKGRGEFSGKKPSDVKVLQKPMEGIKVLSNRQVLVAPSSAQKVLTAPPQKVMSTPAKLVTTKVIGTVAKTRTHSTPMKTEQMIVVSKPSADSRNLASSRLIVTSAVSTAMKERTSESASTVARLTESLTPKGIPATDLKVSAKALVLNPKGQKMVVVPAKSRTKPGAEHERKIPLIHFKGLPSTMKLVPVSQSVPQSIARSPAVAVLSKPAVSSLPSTPKVTGMEPIKTANLADIVPVKGLTPVTTPKITNPIVRPSSAKGNVIVVQKGTPIGKALSFAKNGNDMSKIIMGKNVTQLLQASKTEHAEAGKPPGNVIVLELNNEQSGRPTTLSEILDSRGGARLAADKKPPQITADTPVLFEPHLAGDTCSTSLESATESTPGAAPAEGDLVHKEESKSEGAKESSSVTDWEMELDTVSSHRKDKDEEDKLNSLHLDLGMSSDSEGEYMGTGRKRKGEHAAPPRQATPTSGESGGMYSSSSAMSVATRTLLSQLQDDGSSSNDSSFALRAQAQLQASERVLPADTKLDKVESDELTKAKEKLSEKVAEARSQQRRIDVYSTAIAPPDINLDSFYLDESMMDDHMRRLLGEDCAHADSPVSDSLHK